jgi:Zn-finger nucleic acid-binding protein
MTPVTARANPGSLIQLDQCQQCGGIWCDKWELFPIDPEEAGRVDAVDADRLAAPAELARKTLYCPRCTAKLQACRDPLLPKDLQFDRCQRCDGIWLNRGQLSRYKGYQKKTRQEKMGAKAIVQKIPEVYQNPKSWVVTGTQGIFAYPQGAEEKEQGVASTLGGAFRLILQTLVRLALGI